MGIKTEYVEIDFSYEQRRFICLSDRLGEELLILNDGYPFHLTYMDSTVIGKVFADQLASPYGFVFKSDDGELKVELQPGMHGYIEEEIPNSQFLGAEPEKF